MRMDALVPFNHINVCATPTCLTCCVKRQVAAGLFKHLREAVVSHMTCALPSDMSTDGLLMVENIMLAQVSVFFLCVNDCSRG